MPEFTPDPLPHPPAPGLLTLPPPPPRPLRDTLQEMEVLHLLATITGAPTAIPPALWQTPVRHMSLPQTRDLVKQICTSLAERIPFLAWEFLDWEEDAEALEYFRRIPVEPVGVDLCNGEVVGGGAVFTWVAALAGYLVEGLRYPLPDEMPDGFDVLEMTSFLGVPDVTHPLAALADVVDVLNHNTGTFFLDACPVCWHAQDEDIADWSDENVAWFEEDATRALAILERIDALEAWVKAEPARMTLVWQALVDAHRAQAAQEATAPPQTLVDLWGRVPEGEVPAEMDALPGGGML